jgi:hypothetical protein
VDKADKDALKGGAALLGLAAAALTAIGVLSPDDKKDQTD